ncbi:MAG TPA: hypothetical protein DCP28_11660 [Cytophagales bacterium]|nr:hypothetical protein [Cytophagales bacterium]
MKHWILLSLILLACVPSTSKSPPTEDQNYIPGHVTIPPPAEQPRTFYASDSTIPYLDTTWLCIDPSGHSVIIQNGLPRGGGSIDGSGIRGYIAANGVHYGSALFWSRLVNVSTESFTIRLTFPADSLVIPNTSNFSLSGHHILRPILPTGTLTADKLTKYNYGIEGLKPFLDEHFGMPTRLEQTIGPGEEYMFYVTLLSKVSGGGVLRTGLIAGEEGLRYSLRLEPVGEVSFPCGEITFN